MIVRAPLRAFCLATAVALLGTAWAADALAQPCCAGGTTISPARLALHERALVGVALRFDRKTGDFGRDAGYVPVEEESQVGLREDLLIAARLGEHLQVGTSVSYLQTWKSFDRESDFGGGLGDLAFSARYDFLVAGEHAFLPGIALSSGLSVPTGKTVDHTTHRLAADVTSSGFTQATLALSLEDLFWSRVYVEAAGAFTYWVPRSIEDSRVARRPQVSVSLGASWAVAGSSSVGAIGTLELQGATETDGVPSPGSNRRSTTIAVIAGLPLGDFRLQMSVFDTLPINGLGRNEEAMFGVRVAVIRTLL